MKLLGCSGVLAIAAVLAVPVHAQGFRAPAYTEVFLSALHRSDPARASAARLAFATVGDELSTPRGNGWVNEPVGRSQTAPDPRSVGQAAADPPRVRPAPDPPRPQPQPDGPPGSGSGGSSVPGGDPLLTAVPEPSTILLLATGFLAIGGLALWRKRAG
ncbi:MAG: PEP-CTERM sorting domain-containing protein [Gemmatimonadota bacterium]